MPGDGTRCSPSRLRGRTRLRRPAIQLLAAALVLVATAGACNDDGATTAPSSTTSSTTPPSDGTDEALRARLLTEDDLPEGFTTSDDVDDTITAFCATEDAAAGLQASAREVRGFTRTPPGASIIQLAFRFRDDGAATFVEQAAGALDRCSGIPDATGLAFEYDALTPGLETPIDAASDTHVGRHGVSVGSGNLTIDVVVLQQGDIGQLVAVLGLDLPRTELDALALDVFTAVAALG